MDENNVIIHHVSINERVLIHDMNSRLTEHIGAAGQTVHPLANGTVAGFTMNNFTSSQVEKLAGIEYQANRYVHPQVSSGGHDWQNIRGLHRIANTGDYNHLINIPGTLPNNITGSAARTNGIRITIGNNPPAQNTLVAHNELWFNPTTRLIQTWNGSAWVVYSGHWL